MDYGTFFWSAMVGFLVGLILGTGLVGWAEAHYGDKR